MIGRKTVKDKLRFEFSDNEMISDSTDEDEYMEYVSPRDGKTITPSKDGFDFSRESDKIRESRETAPKHTKKIYNDNVQQPNITSSTAKGAVDRRYLSIREPLLLICCALLSILVYHGFGGTNIATSANLQREGFPTQRIDALDRGILEIKRQHALATTRFMELLSAYQSEKTEEDETRIEKIPDEVQKQLTDIKAAVDRMILHIKSGGDTIYLDMFYKGVAVMVVYTLLVLSIILVLFAWNFRLQNRLKVIENIMKVNSSGQVPGRT